MRPFQHITYDRALYAPLEFLEERLGARFAETVRRPAGGRAVVRLEVMLPPRVPRQIVARIDETILRPLGFRVAPGRPPGRWSAEIALPPRQRARWPTPLWRRGN